jgi:hypothetical protein
LKVNVTAGDSTSLIRKFQPMNSSEGTLTSRIGGMDMLSCHLSEPQPGFAPDQKLNFNLQLKHQILEKDQAIAVLCTIRTLDESSQQELATFTGRVTFAIDGMQAHSKKNEQGQVALPKDLISSLNGITISTMRGLMWSTFKGTYLHRAVLPIVNPDGFNANQHA